MRIIDPYIEVEDFDGIKIMKNIERACRTCYRSEGLITEDSYKKLISNCINRGHQSVLEHEKITVRMTCDIGVYKDLTRHRFGSFSIESTRYCNYGKDKFENEIKLIKPIYIEDSDKFVLWSGCMETIEKTYLKMSEMGCKPDEMRMILPHSTAAQVTMTANIREWRHILELRCAKMTHPSVRQICIPLLLYFKAKMPELFNDIEFDVDFNPEQFAKLSVMKDGED